ncbi:MFS transporter [Spirillospora sp. CA-255316]
MAPEPIVSTNNPSDTGGGDGPPERSLSFRQAAGLLAVILISELAAASYILVATALPGIATHYQTSQVGWAMTLPSLAAVLVISLAGKLADMRGKRLLLVAVVTLATVGTVVSAVAPTFGVFLIGRALQGLLNVVPALAYSLIRDVFPKRIVAFATAITFTGAGIGLGLSPLLAGALIESFGVLSLFWFMTIYQVVVIVILLLTIPESPLRLRSKLDWPGALLIGLGSGALLYGLGQGPLWGWSSPRVIGLFVGGLACFAAWLWWDKRFSHPLIDMGLLRSKPMWTTLLATFFVFAVFGPPTSIVPMMLQTPDGIGEASGFGISASNVVYFMGPMGLGLVIGGLVVGGGARRWGVRTPILIAFVFLAVSNLGLAFLRSTVWEVLFWVVLYGVAMGVAYGGYGNLVLQAAPPESQGIAATTATVFGNIGTGLLTQMAFVALAAHVIPGSNGALYTPQGYTIVFALVALFAVLGLIATLILPHGRRRDVLEMRAGEEVAAELAAAR